MLAFVFALSACSADVVKIEDYDWKMRTVMSNNIEVVINTWEDFYKYWVSEEWRLNENDAWDATK